MIQKRTATCSCRKLQVHVEGEPTRISICHCLDCQVRSGSVFSAQARFEDKNIKVEGEYKTYSRGTKEDADRANFNFCPNCGSTVFYDIEAMPGVTAVAIGAFSDPNFPAPKFSVYENRKHAWVTLPEDGMDHN